MACGNGLLKPYQYSVVSCSPSLHRRQHLCLKLLGLQISRMALAKYNEGWASLHALWPPDELNSIELHEQYLQLFTHRLL